jgi:hypothetical protein
MSTRPDYILNAMTAAERSRYRELMQKACDLESDLRKARRHMNDLTREVARRVRDGR